MPAVAAKSYLRERVLPTPELFQQKTVVYAIRKKRSRIWQNLNKKVFTL